MPKPHYEEGRGYALSDGGYYFAVNDYFDLTLRGNIFTNGTWLANAQSNYRKLYKFSGNLSFSYAVNKTGHEGLPDYSEMRNYSLGWTYSQDAKAHPGSRFSASVNMSSSGFDRNNSYNLMDHVTTQRQSSISYSKTWQGTPFNLSASMNHSQNVKNKTISLNLPRVNFNVARIYPLKSKRSIGPTKWYQELQFQYSASIDNQVNTFDSLLFRREAWEKARSGFRHDIPVSFQIRAFKNFSITPQVSYKGVLYTRKILESWDPLVFNPTNNSMGTVVKDTLAGLFYGHAISPSISAVYSPQVFGVFDFTNPDSRVDAIRHVMKPSVSFNFVPAFSGLSSKMYRQVQVDTTGTRFNQYSVFEGNIFGTPSLANKSGNVAFSLTNILEAKVYQKNDTTGKPAKINIIDNLGISTSYNLFADSLNWSPVSMILMTNLAKKVNISAGSSFSLYALNSKGEQTGDFLLSRNKKLMRLNNFNLSLDFSLSDLLQGIGGRKKTPQTAAMNNPTRPGQSPERGMPDTAGENAGEEENIYDEYGYLNYKPRWTMNISYSLQYYKPAFTSTVSQTLSINGSVKLTRKMNVTYNTGYDFKSKEITMTQLNINRDLHCWDMSFNWVPNGYMKMWTFTIRVKASVLADLKYERRKDYHDNQ
jgi:hypothetical protein